MGYEITKACDFAPGNVGISLAQILRKVLNGLANDVEIEKNAVKGQFVGECLISLAARRMIDDLETAFLDIL